MNQNRRIGYCCQNLSIPSNFRTTTITWLRNNYDLAEKKITNIVEHNLKQLVDVIHWNIGRNIQVFRLTSEFVPAADHPEFAHIWDKIKESDLFKIARPTIERYISGGGRIGTHPAQFTVLSSERQEVVNQSVSHLKYHADLLDLLGFPSNHYFGINIHVSNGSKYESANSNVQRSLEKLPENVLRRLTFETEESGCWTWQNLIKLPVPIVLDFHHQRINNYGDSWDEAFAACSSTWGSVPPLTHYSEGKEHALDTKHSDYIVELPKFDVDIELECKKKDLAVLKLLNE